MAVEIKYTDMLPAPLGLHFDTIYKMWTIINKNIIQLQNNENFISKI